MVKIHKLENGTLCRCVHCAGRRIAFRIVLLARADQGDARDAELMHALTHMETRCARCRPFGIQIQWLSPVPAVRRAVGNV